MISGHCLCGRVAFEISGPPDGVSYCHCTRCQRRTGTAASAQARFAGSTVSILNGEELVRSYQPPDGWTKLFCGECGSALFSRNPHDPEQMSVRLGLLEPGHGLRPQYRQFTDYACEWEPLPDDGLPRYPESRSA